MARSPAQRQRRSIRLKGYDYTRAGAYFVTLCTQDRACLFGSVLEGETQLNEFGRKVADCWLWLAERHPYVNLDEWIVMPNHIHGLSRSRTTPMVGTVVGAVRTVVGAVREPPLPRGCTTSQRVRQAGRSSLRRHRNANRWDV